MPRYAEQADVEAIYPGILLIVADHDDDDAVDTAVVERGLDEATSIIDSHLSVQYDLPLSSIPTFLRTICVDIGVYRMAADEDVRTEEMRLRYEDAIKHLRDIAAGKAGLGLQAGEGEGPTDDAQRRSASVSTTIRR